mgnify:CR=1 FL=1
MESLEIYEYLLDSGIPLVQIQAGLKLPATNRKGSWNILTDPNEALFVTGNVGMLLGQQKDSPVIAVGWDAYKPTATSARATLKSLGAGPIGNVWATRTGRGGVTWMYAYDGEPLPKASSAGGDGALDLLTNGYTLIPDSETSKIPGGGPYLWYKEHSPLDIPLEELDHPPEALLEYWRNLDTSATKQDNWSPTDNPIFREGMGPGFVDGARDNSLTKLAAWIVGHGLHRDDGEFIMRTAARKCKPPIPEPIAFQKLDSAEKKFGNKITRRDLYPLSIEDDE